MRRAKLGAYGRGRSEAHSCESAAGDKRPRRERRQLLTCSVLVPADIGYRDDIARKHAAQFSKQSRGMDRFFGILLALDQLFFPALFPFLELADTWKSFPVGSGALSKLC